MNFFAKKSLESYTDDSFFAIMEIAIKQVIKSYVKIFQRVMKTKNYAKEALNSAVYTKNNLNKKLTFFFLYTLYHRPAVLKPSAKYLVYLLKKP